MCLISSRSTFCSRYCPGGPDSDFEYSTQSYTGYEVRSQSASILFSKKFLWSSWLHRNYNFISCSQHQWGPSVQGTTPIYRQDTDWNRSVTSCLSVCLLVNVCLSCLSVCLSVCLSTVYIHVSFYIDLSVQFRSTIASVYEVLPVDTTFKFVMGACVCCLYFEIYLLAIW